MLILSRNLGEKILIADNIILTVVRIGPNTVRLGIEAPRNMNIVREELTTVTLAEGEDIESSDLLAALTH